MERAKGFEPIRNQWPVSYETGVISHTSTLAEKVAVVDAKQKGAFAKLLCHTGSYPTDETDVSVGDKSGRNPADCRRCLASESGAV